MKMMDNLVGIKPRPVHPEFLYAELLEDLNKPRRMIVIGVRYDHIMYDNIGAVVLMDVLNHLLANAGVSAVH